MSVCPIITFPDPVLKTVCREAVDWDHIKQVVQDLIDTMDAAPPRTVGIAAPQIGITERIAVVDTDRNPKYPSAHGLLVLVNPVIVEHDGEQTFREGCLSIPDYTANVRRYVRIEVQAFDLEGMPYRVVSDGFESIVIQHEIDHLDGILFLDRVSNVKTDLFRRKQSSQV